MSVTNPKLSIQDREKQFRKIVAGYQGKAHKSGEWIKQLQDRNLGLKEVIANHDRLLKYLLEQGRLEKTEIQRFFHKKKKKSGGPIEPLSLNCRRCNRCAHLDSVPLGFLSVESADFCKKCDTNFSNFEPRPMRKYPECDACLYQIMLNDEKCIRCLQGSHYSNRYVKNVHTEHCCAKHGCKYGEEGCPVANKIQKQSYPCESCRDEDQESVMAARH